MFHRFTSLKSKLKYETGKESNWQPIELWGRLFAVDRQQVGIS